MDAVVSGAGVRLAAREFGGTGRPLLLLHGAGNTVLDMAPLASHLSATHRVVGMDLRNHGRSEDGRWEWDAVLADVHAVIEFFELRDVIIVGHSLGGMLASMYTQRYDGIAAAVNLDGLGNGKPEQHGMDAGEAARLVSLLRAAGDRMISELSRPQPAAEVAAAREAWTAGAVALGLDPSLAAEAFDRKLVRGADGDYRTRPASARLVELRTAIEDVDVVELCRKSSVPQLVCIATHDDAGPGVPDELRAFAAAHRRDVARRLSALTQAGRDVRVVEIEATHGLIYECPELLAHEICGYTAGLDAPAVAIGAGEHS